MTTVSDSTTRSNALVGLGGQFDIGDRFGVRLEELWSHYIDVGSEEIVGESDIDLFTLGLRYNFR